MPARFEFQSASFAESRAAPRLRRYVFMVGTSHSTQIRLTSKPNTSNCARVRSIQAASANSRRNGAVTDWASKMAGVAVRVAGLLHLAKHTRHDAYGTRVPIAADTMADAIQVAHYYLAHAVAVFDGLALPPELENARRVLNWATSRDADTDTFTRRDAFRGLSSKRFPNAASLDLPLAVLVEHGYIRELPPERPGSGRGRAPSPTYQTRPDQLTP